METSKRLINKTIWVKEAFILSLRLQWVKPIPSQISIRHSQQNWTLSFSRSYYRSEVKALASVWLILHIESIMKKNLKGICQPEELLSTFDEQNSKQKTGSLWRESQLSVEMYAYRECLEAGTEISKPAEVAFMPVSSSSQWAHPPATTSKPTDFLNTVDC